MKLKGSEPKPFVERRARRWCLTDLFTDSRTGRMQESKMFSVLGKVSALVWFSWKCHLDKDSIELWLVVMVILTAHAAFTTLVSAKFGSGAQTTTTTATAEVVTTSRPKK